MFADVLYRLGRFLVAVLSQPFYADVVCVCPDDSELFTERVSVLAQIPSFYRRFLCHCVDLRYWSTIALTAAHYGDALTVLYDVWATTTERTS